MRLGGGAAGKVVALLLLASLMCMGSADAAAGDVLVLLRDPVQLRVQRFPQDIIRLQVERRGAWNYEVPHVVVAKPVEERPEFSCESSTCHVEIAKGFHLDTEMIGKDLHVVVTSDGVILFDITAPIRVDAEEAVPVATTTFPQAVALYGVPEHAADLVLNPGQTYELYNTDAFQYPLNSTVPLYGAIPFFMAPSPRHTTGLLFLNSAPMTIAMETEDRPTATWKADAGMVDLFLFRGPTPAEVQRQHASVTGSTMLPPLFSLGFHQCRWNYMSTNDCLAVDQGFDRHNIPYDVLWLDIEHTNKKKYMTWDENNFPEPQLLVDALESKGRKLVTVKDPHVKREAGYAMHDEADANNYYVKTQGGDDFVGDCWPGVSSWPDFFNNRTRRWYASHVREYLKKYPRVHTWIDMNEPSIFNSVRGSMPLEAVHTGDDNRKVEHRYIHNMYSLVSLMTTYNGHLGEDEQKHRDTERPFVLTRSFFPGSQRYGAMWTGDNMGRWDHLANSIPELLTLSISNYPFVGADIGGFFFDTEEELFVRWMQLAVFYPFMRAHAHLETKRREPWTFGAVAVQQIRRAVALRYTLLPYLYTEFYRAHIAGSTVIRPLFYDFPGEVSLYGEQQTFMFGSALLVRPVTEQGATGVKVHIPAGEVWYSYNTGSPVPAGPLTMPVDMNSIPMFLRGGYIIPVKLRLRRSSHAMRYDPYTLYVSLNERGNSYGELFIDDGETFGYEHKSYSYRSFSFSGNTLRSWKKDGHGEASYEHTAKLERVIIFGYGGSAKKAAIRTPLSDVLGGETVEVPVEVERDGPMLVLRKPDVSMNVDWEIMLE